jgi:carboxyl-terminal processing protease
VVAPDLPIAVLVNGQSASASEVVAGAVQDLDVGIVVGTRSYGKGLVQQLLSLPFQTALKYTSGRYFTPSGRCIQALSYADKDGDGAYEARAVPDADRKEFLTRRGRIVRDGGGIEPDVISTHRSSFLEAALASQNMFFHFASRYAADRHLAALPPNFAVDDALYRDFVRFAAASDFKYESRFDEAFSSLDDMFSEVGYDAARSKVDALRAATLAEMRADFTRHETSIRAQVESAVRFRLQPESARLTAELAHDDQLADAVRLLRSPAEYRGLLAPRPAIAAVSDAPVADATAADAAADAAAAAAGRASDTASGAPASASARPSPLHGARPHAPVARPVYAA